MGVRLPRTKPRNVLAALAYRLDRILPLARQRKLDLLLDTAAIANRLALEHAAALGHDIWGDNRFIHSRINLTDRVLEIGCSSGRVLSTIEAADRVGVDYDAAAIERGRRDHPQLTLIAGEAHAFLETAEPFDVLILSHVLEHLDDTQDFLASLGTRFDRIYIEVPDFECMASNAVRLARKRDLVYSDGDHVAEFDRDELEAIFGTAGLHVLDSEFRWGAMRYWLTPHQEGRRAASRTRHDHGSEP
jgi:SAM-dependent methyltransferase